MRMYFSQTADIDLQKEWTPIGVGGCHLWECMMVVDIP